MKTTPTPTPTNPPSTLHQPTDLPQQNQHPELARGVAKVKQHRGAHHAASAAPRQVQRLEVMHDAAGQVVGACVCWVGGGGG